MPTKGTHPSHFPASSSSMEQSKCSLYVCLRWLYSESAHFCLSKWSLDNEHETPAPSYLKPFRGSHLALEWVLWHSQSPQHLLPNFLPTCFDTCSPHLPHRPPCFVHLGALKWKGKEGVGNGRTTDFSGWTGTSMRELDHYFGPSSKSLSPKDHLAKCFLFLLYLPLISPHSPFGLLNTDLVSPVPSLSSFIAFVAYHSFLVSYICVAVNIIKRTYHPTLALAP